MSLEKKFELLAGKNRKAEAGGGEARIAKHHEQGKLTARERVAALFDAGTFVEVDKFVTHQCTNFGMEKTKFPGDGVVTGYGKIEGRLAYAFAQDFTDHYMADDTKVDVWPGGALDAARARIKDAEQAAP